MLFRSTQALEAAERERPGIVLMDVRLKGQTDGVSTADAIRLRFGIPVIFLMADCDDATLAFAAETDAFGYVLKPFGPRELHTAIKFALRRHQVESRRRAAERGVQEELYRLSIRDELTDLHNRRGFRALAEHELKVAHRTHATPALLFIDLDGLKPINDDLGHEAGDRALLDTATVLRQTFRDSDIIARLGGDEFVVLVPDGNEGAVARMRARLRENVDRFNKINQRSYRLSLSVGVSYYDASQPEPLEALIATADQRMYEEKSKKRPPISTRIAREAPRNPSIFAEAT